ncbi:MAG: hypothetical protein QOK48_2501 [Blastocatellia bacterium]|jgi:hypothetical protein|nr:hypothetical protein [Blastocatellia bacterium]
MYGAFSNFVQDRSSRFRFVLVGTLTCLALATNVSFAQRRAAADDQEQPAFSEFKGVRIGMKTDEARKKLGSPTDKSAEQDFYVFKDTQAVQVFYDKTGAVNAISIDFMSGEKGIPSAKEVLGSEADAKPEGGVYKMIRYPKAGYWVSYSRTAGNSPTTTITMQKIEH